MSKRRRSRALHCRLARHGGMGEEGARGEVQEGSARRTSVEARTCGGIEPRIKSLRSSFTWLYPRRGGRTCVEGDRAVGCADVRGPVGQGHAQRVQDPPHFPMIEGSHILSLSPRGTGPAGPAHQERLVIAEQSAPAPHLALSEGCAALLIVLVTVLLTNPADWLRVEGKVTPSASSTHRTLP